MSPRLLAAAVLLATPLAACAPTKATHGFQVVEAKPADIKVGEDTRSTVTDKLGSASLVSTFEPNIWYYVSSAMEKKAFFRPKTTAREVVAITFDEQSEKVTEVRKLGLGDGKQIAFNDRETPTRGRELTILEQLLGNVGRVGNVLGDREENDPEARRRRGE
jgi:outer membrane protein assembly factor BamE (lipoprotein component of BamABCDE complex)